MAFCSGRSSGKLPEFGAIFISNRRTKKECLEKELFGLPFESIDFVKNVRAGMILFLFEYERRALYGVFEAISDGGMNCTSCISFFRKDVPCTGAVFIVKIRVMWNCDPLSENCFRHAIEENYYAAYKFNFGLSREQVHRLLLLFDIKRIAPQKNLKQKKVKKMHSRSPDKESLSIDSGNQVITKMFHGIPQKSQSPIAQMSSYKSGNTFSPRSEQMELQKEIKQIEIPGSHFLELGDYIPLSSLEHCEHESNLDHKPTLKGLDSDIPEQRRSVFSRLKLSLQATTQQEKDNSRTLEITESVEKVMQNLQLKHDNWVKMRKKCDTRTFPNVDNSACRRTSVFSRLSFTSEDTGQNSGMNRSGNAMEDVSKQKKKRKLVPSFADHGSMTVQAKTLENKLAVAEASVAKEATENENGSFDLCYITLLAAPLANKRAEFEKHMTVEETTLRDLGDAPDVDHKIAESKPLIAYNYCKKCMSASSSVKEPAEKMQH